MGTPEHPQKHPPQGLTSIHGRIHWPATPDNDDLKGHDELERIDIDNFLETLVEIALSVASRSVTEQEEWSRPNERER